jgi:hypothetical protein
MSFTERQSMVAVGRWVRCFAINPDGSADKSTHFSGQFMGDQDGAYPLSDLVFLEGPWNDNRWRHRGSGTIFKVPMRRALGICMVLLTRRMIRLPRQVLLLTATGLIRSPD